MVVVERSSINETSFPSFALPKTLSKYYDALMDPESETNGKGTSHDDELWTIRDDGQYFELICACENARMVVHEFDLLISSHAFSIRRGWFGGEKETEKKDTEKNDTEKNDKSEELKQEVHRKMLEGQRFLAKLKRFFRLLTKKRLELLTKTTRRPILEVFLDQFNATQLYRQLFHHVLVKESGWMRMYTLTDFNRPSRLIVGYYNSGMNASLSRGAIYNLASIQGLFLSCSEKDDAEFNINDISVLTKSTGLWVQQQVFGGVGAMNTGLFTTQMDQSTFHVFTGLEITVKQFESLKSTFLQKVLEDDPSFQNSATGQAIATAKRRARMVVAQGGYNAKDKDQDHPEKRARLNPLLAAMERKSSSRSRGTKQIFELLNTQNKSGELLEKKRAEQEVEKKLAEQEENLSAIDCSPTPSGGSKPKEQPPESSSNEKNVTEEVEELYGPYPSDLSYLEDQVRLIEKVAALNRVLRTISASSNEDYLQGMPLPVNRYIDPYCAQGGKGVNNDPERHNRTKAKLETELKELNEKIERKLLRNIDGRKPRLEQLCEALELEPFEKYCILELCKSLISPVQYSQPHMPGMPGNSRRSSVGLLIDRFCSSLESRMRSRKYFYKSSALILEGVLTLSQQDFMKDLNDCGVELDRRMFDFIVGLDTEFSELVDGSHLYMPEVEFDDVVLPGEVKERVWDCVSNFEDVKKTMLQYEVDKKFSYGLGQVLLFYGHSGTGKTMLANAIATKLKKQVLLINFPDLGSNSSGPLIKFLFREARINKALLFFDECEALFRSRDLGGKSINMILSEVERFEGICILATNRPNELDEAMHRRISLAIEFRKPDHMMREKIWKILRPPKLPIDDDVDLIDVASKFELTGGLIKNAWLQCIILMKKRGGDKITQDDVTQAASEQVRGQLTLDNFDRRVVPTCGIEALVLSDALQSSLKDITQHTKAQSVLMGQWGFEKLHRSTRGVSVLFTGKPGTGKTMAAEAIGFELGRPLMVVNVAELMSKWVGETGKNIQSVFDSAKKKEAVLVFDEAESLFGKRGVESGSSSRHDTLNVGLLLHHIESFRGVCIVISNLKSAIDEAFFRRFRFVMDFEPPSLKQRTLLWEKMIPKACPLAEDVSLETLAQRYYLCGGDIRSALLRAATRAALRGGDRRKLFMSDLLDSCDEEVQKQGSRIDSASMYC